MICCSNPSWSASRSRTSSRTASPGCSSPMWASGCLCCGSMCSTEPRCATRCAGRARCSTRRRTISPSRSGALDYYTTASWVLRDGRPARVEALSEPEHVVFPPPVGELEAFHTGGGISTLPWAYEGRVRTMEYKTLRYPGHVAIMRPIRELGLLDLTPVTVNGTSVVPRDAFIATVSPKLTKPDGRDLVALRVEVRGTNGKRAAWQLLDYYDAAHGISAMMRTTGYSLAITGLMQVDGRIAAKGVRTPDEAVPFGAYVAELAKRGVEIREVRSTDD